jgi:hypothetical protein
MKISNYSTKNMSLEERNVLRYLRAMRATGRIWKKGTHSKKMAKLSLFRAARACELASKIPVERRQSIKNFIK